MTSKKLNSLASPANPINEAKKYVFRGKEVVVSRMLGSILDANKKEITDGLYAGSYFWILEVKIDTESKKNINKIFASPERLDGRENILKTIEEMDWPYKKYVFTCHRPITPGRSLFYYKPNYWLVDLKEVGSVLANPTAKER